MDELVKRDDFYESLAHLFYAIATVDNRIKPEEKKKIKDLVEAHWSFDIDHENSKTILFLTLKKLFKKKVDPEDAFLIFSHFFNEKRALFSDELKTRILDHTTKIALSFSEINKSESVLISRLFFLMKEKK
jgi:uncharacterized tellurite resistance protein B-like protein